MTYLGRCARAALVVVAIAAPACGDALTGPGFAGEPYNTLHFDLAALRPIDPAAIAMVGQQCSVGQPDDSSIQIPTLLVPYSSSVVPLYSPPAQRSGAHAHAVCLLYYFLSPPMAARDTAAFLTSTTAIARQDLLVQLPDAAQVLEFRRSHPWISEAEELKPGCHLLRTTCSMPGRSELRLADDEPIVLERVPLKRFVMTPTTGPALEQATCAEQLFKEITGARAPGR